MSCCSCIRELFCMPTLHRLTRWYALFLTYIFLQWRYFIELCSFCNTEFFIFVFSKTCFCNMSVRSSNLLKLYLVYSFIHLKCQTISFSSQKMSLVLPCLSTTGWSAILSGITFVFCDESIYSCCNSFLLSVYGECILYKLCVMMINLLLGWLRNQKYTTF